MSTYEQRMTRAEIDAELSNIADGCMGSDSFREQARDALLTLRAGARVVRAGHAVYVVADQD